MLKNSVILLAFAIIISSGIAFAETTIQQIQSPIYTADIGRAHFLGRGGYSSVRSLQMGEAQAGAINEVANTAKKVEKEVIEEVEKTIDAVETDITNVIKERNDVPVSARTKATFSTQDRQMDPSASFGQGGTYLPASGVNESKTMYTDELGRLHFFGKGNLIKE